MMPGTAGAIVASMSTRGRASAAIVVTGTMSATAAIAHMMTARESESACASVNANGRRLSSANGRRLSSANGPRASMAIAAVDAVIASLSPGLRRSAQGGGARAPKLARPRRLLRPLKSSRRPSCRLRN
jgi:hypothetical protein